MMSVSAKRISRNAQKEALSSFGDKNSGKCQPAHKHPRSNEAINGPCAACSLGSAYPRHPGSSPMGPPNSVDQLTNPAAVNIPQFSEAALLDIRSDGRMTNAITISAGPATIPTSNLFQEL